MSLPMLSPLPKLDNYYVDGSCNMIWCLILLVSQVTDVLETVDFRKGRTDSLRQMIPIRDLKQVGWAELHGQNEIVVKVADKLGEDVSSTVIQDGLAETVVLLDAVANIDGITILLKEFRASGGSTLSFTAILSFVDLELKGGSSIAYQPVRSCQIVSNDLLSATSASLGNRDLGVIYLDDRFAKFPIRGGRVGQLEWLPCPKMNESLSSCLNSRMVSLASHESLLKKELAIDQAKNTVFIGSLGDDRICLENKQSQTLLSVVRGESKKTIELSGVPISWAFDRESKRVAFLLFASEVYTVLLLDAHTLETKMNKEVTIRTRPINRSFARLLLHQQGFLGIYW